MGTSVNMFLLANFLISWMAVLGAFSAWMAVAGSGLHATLNTHTDPFTAACHSRVPKRSFNDVPRESDSLLSDWAARTVRTPRHDASRQLRDGW